MQNCENTLRQNAEGRKFEWTKRRLEQVLQRRLTRRLGKCDLIEDLIEDLNRIFDKRLDRRVERRFDSRVERKFDRRLDRRLDGKPYKRLDCKFLTLLGSEKCFQACFLKNWKTFSKCSKVLCANGI